MEFLLAGLGLGLGAGLAPGPLLALVVTTSLARGFRAGARAALSPLLSDLPVVVLSVLVLHSLPDTVVSVLGAAGGLFVVWLGVEALRDLPTGAAVTSGGPDPLRRGALVNLLSPHPWIFWISVGAPLLLAGWAASPAAAAGFLVGFYVLLIGSKIAVAAVVAGGRRRLDERGLRRAHAAGGAVLVTVGVLLAVGYTRALLA